jgi:hypothetical protein
LETVMADTPAAAATAARLGADDATVLRRDGEDMRCD